MYVMLSYGSGALPLLFACLLAESNIGGLGMGI